MKALLVNGSPHERGCTYTALSEVAQALEARGIETEIYWIGAGPQQGCTGCGGCRGSGRCVFGGAANDIADRMKDCGALIVGSPVHYASACGALCSVLDRAFYCASDEFSGKVGAAVVSCRRGGASAAFDRLCKYFTISGMPVASASYWNSVHGNTPDEVRQDTEGLQTMRNLASSVAWLLEGEPAQPAPLFERGARTNFIR